jgi:uroporphyrinogen decarboxylase
MTSEMSSKERMLHAMEHKETDYTPCCFMMFHGLRDRFPGDQVRFIEEQVKMGLDTVVEFPELPLDFHGDVVERTWKQENVPGEIYPVLHKEYYTPAGVLDMSVRKTEDWPYGDSVKLIDDFNVPRAIRHHVNDRYDLKKLRYLMMPPTMQEIKEYREACKNLRNFANNKGLITRGIRGVLVDTAIRLAGVENLVFASIEDPEYVEELMTIIGDWNMHRMEIVLEEKPDFFLKRSWYENMSFWSPDMFRKFMLPFIVKEAKWAHETGCKFAYLNTCSYMQLLDEFLSSGLDVLVGVDPVQDREMDMKALKTKIGARICLWGGANGFVTVERGTREEIRDEVARAMEILAPGSGFILSPVDNVRDTSDEVLDNAMIFIEAWKEMR